ncbi:MAG: S8 family serine peptidase [Saprospiraceae bacterium]|nr:S8 family serine peptidase [Saprospiraceae bacterium]
MYSFSYGSDHQHTYTLTEAPDLLVVRTNGVSLPQLSLSSKSRSLVPHLVPITTFPEADVTVYRVVCHGEQSPIQLRNQLRKELKREPDVRFAGRALKDAQTGIIFIYTENFFVQFKPGLSHDECTAILETHGLKVKEKLGFASNAFFAKAEEGTGLEIFAIAKKLLQLDEVALCHPELIREKKHKSVVHRMQWHLRETTINGQPINQHVGVDEAWGIHRGKGITIAVIDDGVDGTHEEFATPGKVVFPRNTIRDVNNADPAFSRDNHGTACAGVACANGNHKASGVAPEATLMPIISGGLGSLSEAKAFAWAADKGADVISCSWGPYDGDWTNPGDPLHTRPYALPDSTRLAIDYAVTSGRSGKGCIIIWAAGNGNEDIRYDGYASYPKVIAVAACNDQGRRSVYSDYGDAVWCCFPSNDFYAPQFNHPRPLTPGIWTTDRRGREGYNQGGINAEDSWGDIKGDYTARFGGTSSACPGVAGVAALVLGVNPGLTWEDVRTVLRNACDRIDEAGGAYNERGHSIFYGYGRLHAGRAVSEALQSLNDEIEVDVKGTAYFNYSSAVPILEGRFTQDDYTFNRLVGLRLGLQPVVPGLSIAYRVYVHKLGVTAWTKDGDYVGTSDRRRKLVGLEIKLTGQAASQFTIRYRAKLKGRRKVVSGQDGSICGHNARGPALRELEVKVLRK